MRTNDLARGAARLLRRHRRAASLAAGSPLLVLAGCLVSGQFLISFDLTDPLVLPTPTSALYQPIDLTTIEDYNDHKEDLKDVSDLSVLGEVQNLGTAEVSISFWLAPDLTATPHTTAAQVQADPTAVLAWGPLTLAANQTRKLDWDEAAGLFKGRRALLEQVKTDGQFALYILNTSTAPAAVFRVDHGVLVLVVDAGL